MAFISRASRCRKKPWRPPFRTACRRPSGGPPRWPVRPGPPRIAVVTCPPCTGWVTRAGRPPWCSRDAERFSCVGGSQFGSAGSADDSAAGPPAAPPTYFPSMALRSPACGCPGFLERIRTTSSKSRVTPRPHLRNAAEGKGGIPWRGSGNGEAAPRRASSPTPRAASSAKCRAACRRPNDESGAGRSTGTAPVRRHRANRPARLSPRAPIPAARGASRRLIAASVHLGKWAQPRPARRDDRLGPIHPPRPAPPSRNPRAGFAFFVTSPQSA